MRLLDMEFMLDDFTTHVSIPSPDKDYQFLIDEDSGLGMELDFTLPNFKVEAMLGDSRHRPMKRPAEEQEQLSLKRPKSFDAGIEERSFPTQSPATPNYVKEGTNSLFDEDLFVDGPTTGCLPTIQGKHRDLSTISTDTMCDILSGSYDNSVDNATIIDCRYPYEYQGGHIKGAVNIFTKDGIEEFLKENRPTSSTHVLIFHCEFSSKRGPKLCRFLRSRDREMNKDIYPTLNFPEIYLLEGGYKQFYETYKDLCHPQAYTPMLDKQHSADLRHFRVKSKSWAAGDKPRCIRTGLQRLRLSVN